MRAWVTIMRGCDRFCTFCVVPYVRGRERSLPGPVLIEQVRALAAAGVREVVFLGQTVNAYRHDGWDFADLLRRTAEVPGLRRIRFTSPHPADMSDRVIDAMASCPAVMPQLHLPVQSGSDRVLERMARDYTVAEYEALVARLRDRVPGTGALDRRHRRLPRRDRRGLRGDRGADGARALRLRLPLQVLAAATARAPASGPTPCRRTRRAAASNG